MNKEDREFLKKNFGKYGETYLSMAQEEKEYFKSLNLDINKSYFVRGNKSSLAKFESFFSMLCILSKDGLDSVKYPLTDYATYTSSPKGIGEEDKYPEAQVLFLQAHNNISNIGKSEEWLYATINNKIDNRDINNEVTIILSEGALPGIEKNEILHKINLLKEGTKKNKAEALAGLKENLKSSASAVEY